MLYADLSEKGMIVLGHVPRCEDVRDFGSTVCADRDAVLQVQTASLQEVRHRTNAGPENDEVAVDLSSGAGFCSADSVGAVEPDHLIVRHQSNTMVQVDL